MDAIHTKLKERSARRTEPGGSPSKPAAHLAIVTHRPDTSRVPSRWASASALLLFHLWIRLILRPDFEHEVVVVGFEAESCKGPGDDSRSQVGALRRRHQELQVLEHVFAQPEASDFDLS